MPSNIVRRVERDAQIPGLFEALAERLPASDLQSLLLETVARRATRMGLPQAVTRRRESPLLKPSGVDARVLNRFDGIAFETAVEFEALELSPVCPLGLEHRLGGQHQNNILSTIRNVEMLGDSTPALALECALLRVDPAARSTTVRLCASQRVVRLQPFDVEGFTAHFRLFALVSAGRDSGWLTFECIHLVEHVRFYLALFERLNSAGFAIGPSRVEISDTAVTTEYLAANGVDLDAIRERVRAHRIGSSETFLREANIAAAPPEAPTALAALLNNLQREFPGTSFRFDPLRLEGLAYYSGPCFRISPRAPDGNHYPVVDGGFTDWTARLLNNRKERLLTSGIGSEFVCKAYATH
jgi:hypothetical protein